MHVQPGAGMTIDLPVQTITAPKGEKISFDIDPARKERLLEGLDDITLTLKYESEMVAFEAKRAQERSWSTPASQ